MKIWLLLALGSVAGGFARFGLARFVTARWGQNFPWGILIVNWAGCLLVGYLNRMLPRGGWGPDARVLLMAGFCGALTTFSALMLDTLNLAEAAQIGRAALYIFLSFAGGFALLLLGQWAGSL